jgi:hypothetical protein
MEIKAKAIISPSIAFGLGGVLRFMFFGRSLLILKY